MIRYALADKKTNRLIGGLMFSTKKDADNWRTTSFNIWLTPPYKDDVKVVKLKVERMADE